MKRLSISLLAMLCALPAEATTPAFAAQVVGTWQIEAQTDPEIKAKCIMQMMADPITSVFAVVDQKGSLRIGLRKRSRFDLMPNEDPNVELIFDDKPSGQLWSSVTTAEVVMTDAPDQADDPNDLESELRKSRKLEARARGVAVRIVVSDTADAVDALRRCEAEADEVDRNQPVAGSDGGDVSGQGTKPSSPSQEADAAQRLGQALHGIGSQAPTLAQFQCEINTAQLYGILTPGSQDRTSVITLNVAEDGVGVINGGSFQPAYRDGGPASGDIRSLAYSVKDIIAATSPAPEHVAPPLVNMTDSEMAAFRAALGFMQGAGDMMLAGRDRYLMVSLADDVVHLFDLTPQNEAVNIATLRCVRTM